LTTLLAAREESFTATTPLQKVLGGDGSKSLRINPSADVVANAFLTGAFRLHSPDLGGAEIQYNDGGWQRVCKFFWDAGDPSLLVDTIKAAGSSQVTCADNLHVAGTLTVTGGDGIDKLNPFWCAGKVAGNGAILTTKGRYPYTVTNITNGVYDIGWSVVHPDGAQFIVTYSNQNKVQWSKPVTIGIDNDHTTSLKMRVVIQDTSGVAYGSEFSFTVVA
jgi:hypothetical protein